MEKFDTFSRLVEMLFLSALVYRCSQGQNESIEQYITSLYQLAENCDYGELKDEMI